MDSALQFMATRSFGTAHARFPVGALGDACYHKTGTPTNKDIEPTIYSQYGGHGLKIFVYCAPRQFGYWVYDVNICSARVSDYTGSDTSDLTYNIENNNLFALGDKGLSSKLRSFVTPYKKSAVLKTVRGYYGTRRKEILKNFAAFNNDIGRDRYVHVKLNIAALLIQTTKKVVHSSPLIY